MACRKIWPARSTTSKALRAAASSWLRSILAGCTPQATLLLAAAPLLLSSCSSKRKDRCMRSSSSRRTGRALKSGGSARRIAVNQSTHSCMRFRPLLLSCPTRASLCVHVSEFKRVMYMCACVPHLNFCRAVACICMHACEFFLSSSPPPGRLGHPSACRNLALLYSLAEQPDWERAFAYFYKSASLGNVKAMESLAQCYRLGQGTKPVGRDRFACKRSVGNCKGSM